MARRIFLALYNPEDIPGSQRRQSIYHPLPITEIPFKMQIGKPPHEHEENNRTCYGAVIRPRDAPVNKIACKNENESARALANPLQT
jgi:hypothetical protein